ncbi:hypothetical protein OCU04_000848 [Sclerotinia nivalis]|uniref:Uncharacterized protein n=1 Tax=Sclerotinia nivalis TaxID=352851 RepID=A0A9X0DP58_9HELO|nr:hypothetical protein OCU04_000848 [Sclerotinia nivalis]
MGEVVGPGPYKIRARDSGIVPTLEQFDDASWEVVLFTGSDTAPVSFVSILGDLRRRIEGREAKKRIDELMLNLEHMYSLNFINIKCQDTKCQTPQLNPLQ